MAITVYFDTYAFFELIRGNPNYKQFAHNHAILTTRFNLMELFYGLLLRFNNTLAEHFYDRFLLHAVDIDDAVIKQAMHFRALHREKGFSYIDCIGYTIALRHNISFVTGNEQFRTFPHVTFLK